MLKPNISPMNTYRYYAKTDAELINVAEETERNFWATRLGVSIEKLKSAIRATHSLDYQKVKNYLYRTNSKNINLKNYAKN
ncbi:MAG: DUF3606 domain-containing protein [Pedobacter sp.]|nr:MAG: DUF3606 domain-containing protein [Pedobacter sp.]